MSRVKASECKDQGRIRKILCAGLRKCRGLGRAKKEQCKWSYSTLEKNNGWGQGKDKRNLINSHCLSSKDGINMGLRQ